MTIVLGGHTALEVMRAETPLVLRCMQHSHPSVPRVLGATGSWAFSADILVRPRADDADRVRSLLPSLPQGPLEAVVPKASLRSNSRLFECRVESPLLPKWAIVEIANDVHICHPALVLVQLSREHSVEHVASIGSELCGSYRKAPGATAGFFPSRPLISRKLLMDCMDGLSGIKGTRNGRAVAVCTFDGARSPMESDLSVLFGSATLRGGYSLGSFEMNGLVKVPRDKAPLCTKPYYLCDFLWRRERVAVEYDSDLCHTGSGRIADDAARRNALSSLGYQVLTLTKRQLLNWSEFSQFMATLEVVLGKQRADCSATVVRKRERLWFSLVGHLGTGEGPIEAV